jgi:hypothetical protein
MGQGRELLGPRDVLVIDEAGMIGTRQMERVLSEAERAGAKVVLVGDAEQLQAIEAGAAFRALAERHGAAEINEVRRQHEDWQRDATRALATGRTGEAIHAYEQHGMVHAAETREAARAELIDTWDAQRRADPDKTRIILTHTNAEVRDLNQAARDRLRDAGELGQDVRISAERGARDFASGDRIMFLKNERGMGVKNGTLGKVERVSPDSMAVRLDDGRQVAFDLKDYAHVDHGYAATIHKSQGVTVDQGHVLATPGMDRHSAYVALSRHRDGVQLHYGRDDFADDRRLVRTLGRERAKDMASDYPMYRDRDAEAQSFADRRGLSGEIRVADAPERKGVETRAPRGNLTPDGRGSTPARYWRRPRRWRGEGRGRATTAAGYVRRFRPRPPNGLATAEPGRARRKGGPSAACSTAETVAPPAPTPAKARRACRAGPGPGFSPRGRASLAFGRGGVAGPRIRRACVGASESRARARGQALDQIRPGASRDLASAMQRDPACCATRRRAQRPDDRGDGAGGPRAGRSEFARRSVRGTLATALPGPRPALSCRRHDGPREGGQGNGGHGEKP